MYNKYTLKFSDPIIEEAYQEYLTIIVRKFILFTAIINMTLWSTIDLIQFLLNQQLDDVSFEMIVQTYVLNYTMIGIITLIYFFKTNYIRWALLISNHFLAYCYWNQDKIYNCQQSQINTVVVVGTQMFILMTSDFFEMSYQVFLFACIYLTKMLLSSSTLKYSLLIGYFGASTSFIIIFYQIQKNLRQQFKIRYTNDLWEKIFMALYSGKFLTFNYDFSTQSFNFGKQNNFNEEITDTKTLRNYLRSMFVNYKKHTLEAYLFAKFSEEKIFIKNLTETLSIHYGSKSTTVKITIFDGIKPILILQQEEGENPPYQQQILQVQNNFFKQFSKKILFSKVKTLNIIVKELKKCWIYQHLKENLYLFVNSQIELTHSKYSPLKLLQKIANLYPKRTIVILNPGHIEIIKNNKSLVATIFFDIIENILSSEIKISLDYLSIELIQVSFNGFVNEKSFQNITKIAEKYHNYIESIHIDITGVQVILYNENIEKISISHNQEKSSLE